MIPEKILYTPPFACRFTKLRRFMNKEVAGFISFVGTIVMFVAIVLYFTFMWPVLDQVITTTIATYFPNPTGVNTVIVLFAEGVPLFLLLAILSNLFRPSVG